MLQHWLSTKVSFQSKAHGCTNQPCHCPSKIIEADRFRKKETQTKQNKNLQIICKSFCAFTLVFLNSYLPSSSFMSVHWQGPTINQVYFSLYLRSYLRG